MKKFVASILAVLYLGTSTGAAVYVHYCMGELAGWGIGYNQSKTCGKCGMDKDDENDNGCCKDENKFIKNHNDQKAAENSFQTLLLSSTSLPMSFIELPAIDFPTVTEENPISHAPPRSVGLAVYIRNCIFLI